jgi:hypothetical protein
MSEIVSLITTIAEEVIELAWKILKICAHGVKIVIFSTVSISRTVLRLAV